MTTPTSIYPNTTPAGEVVLDDLLNPTSAYIMPFTTAALGGVATLYAVADEARIV